MSFIIHCKARLHLTVNILLLLLQVIHTSDLNNSSWGVLQ